MKPKRRDQVIQEMVQLLNTAKPTREDVIIILGKLLAHIGYVIYYGYETTNSPSGKIDLNTAREMYRKEQTLGTTLLDLGFTFQTQLLREFKATLKEGN